MTIQQYQKECFRLYKESIGYPSQYTYFYGNPINVLVPVETPLNKIMVVGAYPSAKFYTINGISDTPVADNDSPFSNETYFDGSRVRTIPSGKELNEVILQKIGIRRSDCWITDLVKVFLFKEGHVNRYKKLGKNDVQENRSRFIDYASKSIVWLAQEISICNPQLIILLGSEVTQVVYSVSQKKATEFLNGKNRPIGINGESRNVVCLPHPGILMKPSSKNSWPKRFSNEISKNTKTEIEYLRTS